MLQIAAKSMLHIAAKSMLQIAAKSMLQIAAKSMLQIARLNRWSLSSKPKAKTTRTYRAIQTRGRRFPIKTIGTHKARFTSRAGLANVAREKSFHGPRTTMQDAPPTR
ncbi:MAG: hypothetical protein WB716_12540 [Candidatus Acidiferrales bacterium]